MRRVVISSKGRVTIPAQLREKLGLNPGTHVNWSKEKKKLVLTPLTTRRAKEVGDLSRPKPTTND
jgi:AbrB family looped-hinge helix DNA binding protein